jgi:DNA polymerase-3 subunit gamma/tau
MDVIEIDGASHNKVEDMRDIREQVQYVPGKCRYKIYIIDEVHMLTSGAWNALLKTLEEPPPHVKFLFATTEPHKVLPTIISRCQRFDLKRIPAPLIAQRLRLIADNEKLFVDDAALNAIARAADGGMRDAQSIFDQMIAFCGGMSQAETISEQDVINVFGLASGGDLKEIAAGIFTNQLDRALDVVAALADAGRDLERVYEDLVGYIRNLMLAGCCRDAANFIEASPEELAALCDIASKVAPRLIQRTLQRRFELFTQCFRSFLVSHDILPDKLLIGVAGIGFLTNQCFTFALRFIDAILITDQRHTLPNNIQQQHQRYHSSGNDH